MTFTDDDLKRLQHILQWEDKYVRRDDIVEMLPNLIARLEAAEDYIGALTTGSGIKTAHLFEEAWRKAAGK